MCGIAGVVTPQPDAYRDRLTAMSSAIAHRGPNDRGEWSDNHALLAHRRLSILDTSAAGHQPMLSHDGRYVLVYNGEIYNYVELRGELEKLGVTFHSHSDSEVLLAAFAAWGEQCLDKFNGMWAFAIWDRTARSLFIARDRFGIKPFYYATRGGDFLFASEVKALLATGMIDRAPDAQMIADFCAERVSDHTSRTFFRGISQLPAGTCGWWRDGQLKLNHYWSLPPDDTSPPRADIVEEVTALLEDAVRLRLRSDIPVGTLLSGGLDSSGVTCLATRLASTPISAFSTIDRQPPEEAAGIDHVLQANPGIAFHRDQPDDNCLDAELEACLWHQEQPFADGSMLAHFRLMRLARERGVRVLLTGQAADEVFAGYPGHLAIHLGGLIRRGRWPAAISFHRALRSSGQQMAWRGVASHALPAALAGALRARKVAREVDWLAAGCRNVSPKVARGYAASSGDPLNAALRESISCRTLPGFLHYEDRNSMAFGVETRIPYLDYRLVEKVLPLGGATKLDEAHTKTLLREALANTVPRTITARLAKQGYPAPLARWLRDADTAKQADRRAVVAACPLIDFPRWQRRQQRFAQGDDGQLPGVWRGLVLALWYERFIRQRT